MLCLRFCLHAMLFGNARAVATLWNLFIQHLRFSHWDPLQPLPRMPHNIVQPSLFTLTSAQPSSSSLPLDIPISTAKQPSQEPSEQSIGELQLNSRVQAGNRSDAAQDEPPAPDLRQGLLHQKLQMLDLCIHRQQCRAAAAQAAAQDSGTAFWPP